MVRRLIAISLIVAAFSALAWFVAGHFTIDQLAEQESQLRRRIAAQPLSSFLIGLLIYSFVSLVPGTSGKSIAFGWLFGFWQGVLMVVGGLTAAAMMTLWLSRYVLRRFIESRFSKFIGKLNRAVERDGAFYLLTLRMAHVPFSWINYCCGATRISSWTFGWTTAVGLLPGTVLFVYVGSQLPTLTELAEQGVDEVVGPWLIAGLVATATLPMIARWCYRRFDGLFNRGDAGKLRTAEDGKECSA